ncbi:hypothetical protein HAX54_004904 [Datura stramonium]|uniref:W2 domain-containing protein n=1 Tax=Datura stramonium TaxID=4076 RepID=A0ABS8T7S4_DATST|nr:hypothetical protein [Datura stramonium]
MMMFSGKLIHQWKLLKQRIQEQLNAVTAEMDIVTAVYEALLDGVEKGFAKELIKKKGYLLASVGQEDGSQLRLLRALEEFCGKLKLAAVKEVALVLKALYDADVLEEEFIVQWYQEGVAGVEKDSKIWKNVKPFVDWLQSAESESEED